MAIAGIITGGLLTTPSLMLTLGLFAGPDVAPPAVVTYSGGLLSTARERARLKKKPDATPQVALTGEELREIVAVTAPRPKITAAQLIKPQNASEALMQEAIDRAKRKRRSEDELMLIF